MIISKVNIDWQWLLHLLFFFQECKTAKIMDIQNSKEKEDLSGNVLVSGNYKHYVYSFQAMILLLEKMSG